jgi:hypothetical protein
MLSVVGGRLSEGINFKVCMNSFIITVMTIPPLFFGISFF